ncbi:MAG: hypothetical protein ACRDCE_01540 [Cetobacterium sp.]|uniref:hypothetical protein n=1 Tax=Cetobacterium sp. TaxID=2071632 RepID=UPI003EE4C191
MNELDWSNAVIVDNNAPVVENLDWSSAQIMEEPNWSEAVVVEDSMPVEYTPSIQTSFEGYGSDGIPDFSNEVWGGYNPTTATQEEKERIIDKISKDLAFQRSEENKQAYQDWRTAKEYANLPIMPTTYQENYGQYDGNSGQRRLDRARMQGEEAVMNRASQIKSDNPSIPFEQAVSQARRDVKADAVDFAISTGLGLATGGVGSGLGALGRIGSQAGVNALTEAAGQLTGDVVRGDVNLGNIASRALLGGLVGGGAELLSPLISAAPRSIKEGANKINSIKEAVKDAKAIQRRGDVFDDFLDVKKIDEFAAGTKDAKGIQQIQQDLINVGREDLAEAVATVNYRGNFPGASEARDKAAEILKSESSQRTFKMLRNGIDTETKTVLDEIDARGLLGKILGTDLLEAPRALSPRNLSDVSTFGASEAIRGIKRGRILDDVTKELSNDLASVIDTQRLVASTPSDAAYVKGAAHSVEDLSPIAQKISSGGRLTDKDVADLVASSEAFQKSGKGDEIIRAIALRDARKAGDKSTADVVIEKILDPSVSNIAKRLGGGALLTSTSGLGNALATAASEGSRAVSQVISAPTRKRISDELTKATKLDKKKIDELIGKMEKEILDDQRTSRVVREAIEGPIDYNGDNDTKIIITGNDVDSNDTSELAKLVGMWNDGLLTESQAKAIYDNLTEEEKKIADELNKRK